MKKIWVVMLAIVSVLSVAAMAYVGYQLTTAKTVYTIVEGIELQYYQEGVGWTDLPNNGNVVDLAGVTISPGESKTLWVQGRNIADNGVLGAIVNMPATTGLSYTIACNQTGVEWTSSVGDLYFKLPAGAGWQPIGITVLADGSLPPQDINVSNTISRDSALTSYDNTCSMS